LSSLYADQIETTGFIKGFEFSAGKKLISAKHYSRKRYYFMWYKRKMGVSMAGRKKLRELITRQGYTIVPGVYDALTARLAQMTGFEAVYITGGGITLAGIS
jgi:hypothetical protein